MPKLCLSYNQHQFGYPKVDNAVGVSRCPPIKKNIGVGCWVNRREHMHVLPFIQLALKHVNAFLSQRQKKACFDQIPSLYG